ncbi:hypothetical protein FS842_006487 [Serendipita sp. 407]|nr:hypothetical protein FS842_006487 [Serendipita sp. 407]
MDRGSPPAKQTKRVFDPLPRLLSASPPSLFDPCFFGCNASSASWNPLLSYPEAVQLSLSLNVARGRKEQRMPTAVSRQHSASRQSSRRPESPIKRTSSARQQRSARSPSPFAPNTSHNEMPSPISSMTADSTSILKPSQPVRRRSARIAQTSVAGSDGASTPNGMTKSPSMNGSTTTIEDIIEKIDQHITGNGSVPNGHGSLERKISDLGMVVEVVEESPSPKMTNGALRSVEAVIASPNVPISPPVKKIDWEIPRKTLHSSIGIIVSCLYAFSFTIPPIVAVLSILLAGISLIDFVRLRNPNIERLYEKSVGFLMRESEKHKVNGTVWYLIGVILVLTFYPADIAVLSILILSWADTAASTIGRLWGRYTPPLPRRIPYIGLRFAPRKSTAGYAAAFVTGGLITATFLGIHAARGTSPAGPLPTLSWTQIKESSWDDILTTALSYTNLNNTPVIDMPSSWHWQQRVGGDWAGLIVAGLWSGFVTAVAEAMGVIPAIEAQEGAQEPGLNDFKANDKFLNLMHDTIQRALRDGADEAIQAEATQRGSGWLHIHDERNVPALGRIGDPDDIVASVMVENGKILSETYQRMPSYRLFTADGPPKLSPGLAHKLEEALLKEHRREGGE